jgi:hypothetical protein
MTQSKNGPHPSHCEFYREDPLVKRVLGPKSLPSVPTVSRMLSEFDDNSVAVQQAVNRDLVLERLQKEALHTVTSDFDGIVQSTQRHAEGTAVGFSKEKKGARSYYPLFCTVAQTGQVLDVLHPAGNVHDSKGAVEYVTTCVKFIRERLPLARLEVRLDSAFFSDTMVPCLEKLGVEYTISVPFERFVLLKERIEKRLLWCQVPGSGGSSQYLESRWKPQNWAKKTGSFSSATPLLSKRRAARSSWTYLSRVQQGREFKVIVTKKTTAAGKVARVHEGRGYQEKIYGELKNQAQMGYVPARRLVANKIYLLCSLLAHNLSRELPGASAWGRRTIGLSKWPSRDSIRCVAPSLPEPASDTSTRQISIDPQCESNCSKRAPASSPGVIL